MLPLFAMLLLGCSGAGCRNAQARPADSGDTDADAESSLAPIHEFLAGTTWTCELVALYGPDEYRIPHTWEFFEDGTVDSDVAEAIKAYLDLGRISLGVGYSVGLYTWGQPDSFGTWTIGRDVRNRRWRGFGERLVMIEIAAPSATDFPYTPVVIDRYSMDGKSRAIFSIGDQVPHLIDCELVP